MEEDFKYRIFYIQIKGIHSKKTEIFTNNLKEARKEIADKFDVTVGKVKFKYDHLTEKWDDLKHPIPLEK